MTQATPSPRQADALLRALTRTLAAVGLLAAAFTAVNVTLFAHAHGVPWPIAILLDPMTALALAAVLLADARLASWGIRPPGWSATLRWFTGTAATVTFTGKVIPLVPLAARFGVPVHVTAWPANVQLHTPLVNAPVQFAVIPPGNVSATVTTPVVASPSSLRCSFWCCSPRLPSPSSRA